MTGGSSLLELRDPDQLQHDNAPVHKAIKTWVVKFKMVELRCPEQIWTTEHLWGELECWLHSRSSCLLDLTCGWIGKYLQISTKILERVPKRLELLDWIGTAEGTKHEMECSASTCLTFCFPYTFGQVVYLATADGVNLSRRDGQGPDQPHVLSVLVPILFILF